MGENGSIVVPNMEMEHCYKNIITKHISSAMDHFTEINGCYLKSIKNYKSNFSENESNSSLEIIPTKQVGQISVSVSRWKMALSSMQNLTRSSVPESSCAWIGNDENLFSFSQRPVNNHNILLKGKNSSKVGKFVDIHNSVDGSPIGWIKLRSQSINEPEIMMDITSGDIFTLDSSSDYCKISDLPGKTVATLQPKKGLRKRASGLVQWTDWKIKFITPNTESLPTSLKVITLVAFMLKINKYTNRWQNYPLTSHFGKEIIVN